MAIACFPSDSDAAPSGVMPAELAGLLELTGRQLAGEKSVAAAKAAASRGGGAAPSAVPDRWADGTLKHRDLRIPNSTEHEDGLIVCMAAQCVQWQVCSPGDCINFR